MLGQFDNNQVYWVLLDDGSDEEMFTDIQVQSLATETVASDGALGSGCSPETGPLPDGMWFGFVAARASDSFDFDVACIFPDPIIDQPPVNSSTTLRSVQVGGDALVREMLPPEPAWAGTTYRKWQPDACQFDDGCAAWIEIRDGRAIYISEEFFS